MVRGYNAKRVARYIKLTTTYLLINCMSHRFAQDVTIIHEGLTVVIARMIYICSMIAQKIRAIINIKWNYIFYIINNTKLILTTKRRLTV